MSRLRAVGYGEEYAVASNADPVGRALNRRLSIKVITKYRAPLQSAAVAKPTKPRIADSTPAKGKPDQASAARASQRPDKPQQRSRVGRWFKNMGQRLRGKHP